MNILPEPLVNYVILWENRDQKTDTQFIHNRTALVYVLFISLLHIIKNKHNFIKYKLITKCAYIFLCFLVE